MAVYTATETARRQDGQTARGEREEDEMATGEEVRLKIGKATKIPKAIRGRCHGNLRRLVCPRPCRLAVWPHGPSDVYSRDAAAGVRREMPRWDPTSSLLWSGNQ